MIPRKLPSFEGDKLITHLCKLEGEDRRLRFGGVVTDSYIADYVTKSLSEDDDSEWFVIGENRIIAACHVAIYNGEGELGCSVDPKFRGLGLAQAMFDRSVTYLRSKGIRDVYMHCLTENQIMRHIARKNDMTVVSCYGETDARVQVQPPTPMTVVEDVYLDRIALYDMLIRSQSGLYGAWLQAFRYGKKVSES